VTGLPLLKQGSQGQAVRNLQGLLAAAARATPIDGRFGPGTDRVLRQWQAAAGLTADGICGNRTWSVLLGARVG
jgi:peptidoglycan hydrolase-like protein with peptidoglycan-binding domain